MLLMSHSVEKKKKDDLARRRIKHKAGTLCAALEDLVFVLEEVTLIKRPVTLVKLQQGCWVNTTFKIKEKECNSQMEIVCPYIKKKEGDKENVNSRSADNGLETVWRT